jgi:hypothetical protein
MQDARVRVLPLYTCRTMPTPLKGGKAGKAVQVQARYAIYNTQSECLFARKMIAESRIAQAVLRWRSVTGVLPPSIDRGVGSTFSLRTYVSTSSQDDGKPSGPLAGIKERKNIPLCGDTMCGAERVISDSRQQLPINGPRPLIPPCHHIQRKYNELH